MNGVLIAKEKWYWKLSGNDNLALIVVKGLHHVRFVGTIMNVQMNVIVESVKMNKPYYEYPAIFVKNEFGIAVEFPDLPGCYTCGKNIDEAIEMAKDALACNLQGMIKDGDVLPTPSDPTTWDDEMTAILITVILQ